MTIAQSHRSRSRHLDFKADTFHQDLLAAVLSMLFTRAIAKRTMHHQNKFNLE